MQINGWLNSNSNDRIRSPLAYTRRLARRVIGQVVGVDDSDSRKPLRPRAVRWHRRSRNSRSEHTWFYSWYFIAIMSVCTVLSSVGYFIRVSFHRFSLVADGKSQRKSFQRHWKAVECVRIECVGRFSLNFVRFKVSLASRFSLT